VIRRPRSIRFRVLAVAVLLVVVGMLVVNLMALLTLRANLMAKVDQQLLAVPGEAFGPLLREPPPTSTLDPSSAAANSSFLNNQVITILDGSTGTVVDQLAGPAVRDAPPPDLSSVSAQVGSGQVPSGLMTVGAVGDPGYHYRIRVIQPLADPTQVVVFAKSLADIQSTLARVGIVDAVVSVALLGALIVIGRAVMRIGLQPLTDVDEAAARIGAGDFSVRAPHANEPGEVGHLSRTFNEMADEIEEAFREQREAQLRLRRFVSDASHELRTPLTSIRAYAELLRRGALPDGADARQASQRIEAEAQRMGTLVNDLLLLARLDEQRTTEPSRVDLGQLVAEMATDIAMTAPTHTVTCQVEADTFVLGDEPQLRQLVGNLLRNAVVHTPPETFVEASVGARGPDVVIVVADDGPGMLPEVSEHAFERFFRPEPGRTRGSGSGLGLAIVEAIATSHGGSVDLESSPGSGTRFTVTLPSTAEPRETRANAEPILRSAGASPEARTGDSAPQIEA
jgi:two-component system, OmpR family, sensor kinase